MVRGQRLDAGCLLAALLCLGTVMALPIITEVTIKDPVLSGSSFDTDFLLAWEPAAFPAAGPVLFSCLTAVRQVCTHTRTLLRDVAR